LGKAREKQAKTGENTRKQAKNRRFFGANFFGGKNKNWSVLIFTPFATMFSKHFEQVANRNYFYKQLASPAGRLPTIVTTLTAVTDNSSPPFVVFTVLLVRTI